jgi:AraC-like DNA-binding protein/mannose-6-phosphate isomerase-like protein (cupin superfamily)
MRSSSKSRRVPQVLRSREYFQAGFPLFILECEQKAISAHGHDFFEMVYVRRGRGAHHIGRQKFALRAGDLFIIHPGESHSYTPEAGTALQIVNVLWQPELVREVLGIEKPKARRGKDSGWLHSESLPYIEPLFKARSRFHHHLHLGGSAAFRVEVLLDEMRREAQAAREGQAAPGCHGLLRHLFCALLILLSRVHEEQSTRRATSTRHSNTASPRAAQQDAVARAIAFLEARWNQPLCVDEVASHVALSSSRLAHLFKQHTGRSPMAYLQALRIERACGLLRESTLSTQRVATECGFGDTRFFHRVFRRHAGCSPLQWRKQNAT